MMDKPAVQLGYAGRLVGIGIILMTIVILLRKRKHVETKGVFYLECFVVGLMIVAEFVFIIPVFGF